MDKIIYVSQIKWTKAREHIEHICFIADSAILPKKHAYRIKISSTMPLDVHHKMATVPCSGTVTLTEFIFAIQLSSKMAHV